MNKKVNIYLCLHFYWYVCLCLSQVLLTPFSLNCSLLWSCVDASFSLSCGNVYLLWKTQADSSGQRRNNALQFSNGMRRDRVRTFHVSMGGGQERDSALRVSECWLFFQSVPHPWQLLYQLLLRWLPFDKVGEFRAKEKEELHSTLYHSSVISQQF